MILTILCWITIAVVVTYMILDVRAELKLARLNEEWKRKMKKDK